MSGTIQFANESTLPQALSLFLRGLSDSVRVTAYKELLTLIEQGHLLARHYILLFNGSTPTETIHFEVVTGEVGIVQLPCLAPHEDTTKTSELLHRVIVSTPRLRFAYCLTDASDEAHQALINADFRPVTNMETWCLDLAQSASVRKAHPNPQGISHPKSIQDCLALLSETQTRSTDLPELEGLRTPEEVWRGYSLVAPRESSWWIYQIHQEPVGLAIVDQRQNHRWGLAFIGVKPAFRHQGIGSLILSRILAKAQSSNVTQIDILVDSRNWHARRLYTSFGFSVQISRPIYLWVPHR